MSDIKTNTKGKQPSPPQNFLTLSICPASLSHKAITKQCPILWKAPQPMKQCLTKQNTHNHTDTLTQREYNIPSALTLWLNGNRANV
jgi:hypothetical protein